MTSATGAASEGSIATIELGVTGMTCAACAMRVEKRLNRLEGVAASVNYATEARSSWRFLRAMSTSSARRRFMAVNM